MLDDNVDTDSLIPADREAILVWLRIGGYGNIYPVTATDKETGKTFNADVDLTKLKYKKFSLIPDENGHFTFKLPVGGQVVKFKYLTYKDTKELTEQTIKEFVETLDVKESVKEELRAITPHNYVGVVK